MAERIQNELGMYRRIAVGCLHLLLNRASLEFPGSTRGSPSRQVVVVLTPRGALDPNYGKMFPFSVPGPLWNRVVAPILETQRVKIIHSNGKRNRGKVLLLDQGDHESLISSLSGELIAQARIEGYLPTETETSVDEISVDTEPSEDVIDQSDSVGITYTRFDT